MGTQFDWLNQGRQTCAASDPGLDRFGRRATSATSFLGRGVNEVGRRNGILIWIDQYCSLLDLIKLTSTGSSLAEGLNGVNR